MYKVNTEKLIARYSQIVAARAGIVANCQAEAMSIASARGYSAELSDKLAEFLYAEKYKEDNHDDEIAFIAEYIDDVTEETEVVNG